MQRINKQKTFNFLNRKNKWLGLIDYKTICFFLVYSYAIVLIANKIFVSFTAKLYMVILFIFPAFLFIILNINEECIVDKFITIIKFLLKRKKFVNERFYTKTDTIYVENVDKHRIVKSKK